MTPPSLVRNALAVNAGFSLASGLVLSIVPGTVGDLVGVETTWILRVFGFVLFGHAVALAAVVGTRRITPWAKLNFIAIAPYPLAMVIVAVMVASDAQGRALVLADGAAIALIAIALGIGLRRPVAIA